MKYFNYVALNASSMAANVTSSPIQIEQVLGYACAVLITGAPVGTLTLQGSCDAPQAPLGTTTAPTNFIDIGGTSLAINGATNVLYNVDAAYYNWVRLSYTRTSGSGNLTATFNAKGE